jgi:capsular polysaccharide transport system permease protein
MSGQVPERKGIHAVPTPPTAGGQGREVTVKKTELTFVGTLRPMLEGQASSLRRMSLNRLLFILLVAAPTFLATIYYTFICTGRYVSEAQMLVTSSSATFSPGTTGSASTPIPSSSFSSVPGLPLQSFAVSQYIQSDDIVDVLQKKVDIRGKWSRTDADWISRLGQDATKVRLGKCYYWYTDVDYDPTTGLIDLTVEAFSPEDAQAIASAIIKASDDIVDSLNERSRNDTVGFAQHEVERTAQKLVEARAALEVYRAQHTEVDPAQAAQGLGSVVGDIETNLSRAQTQLTTWLRSMDPNSPAIVQLKAKIQALEAQRTSEQNRVGEQADKIPLAQRMTEFSRLQTEEQLQLAAYQTAVQLLESSEADVQHQHLYLVPFVKPSHPDESTRPIRTLMVAIVFVGGLVIYGLLSLGIAAVREHARH